jgi:hypothetical protein
LEGLEEAAGVIEVDGFSGDADCDPGDGALDGVGVGQVVFVQVCHRYPLPPGGVWKTWVKCGGPARWPGLFFYFSI